MIPSTECWYINERCCAHGTTPFIYGNGSCFSHSAAIPMFIKGIAIFLQFILPQSANEIKAKRATLFTFGYPLVYTIHAGPGQSHMFAQSSLPCPETLPALLVSSSLIGILAQIILQPEISISNAEGLVYSFFFIGIILYTFSCCF